MTTREHIARYGMLSLAVDVELGRSTLLVREILSLAPGSVIKLSSPVGSCLEIYVGGARFGSGEMVRAGDSAAVRMVFDEQNRES